MALYFFDYRQDGTVTPDPIGPNALTITRLAKKLSPL
jgi:hypothetical protein